MAKPRSPYDIPLSDEQKTTLAIWLQSEVTNAMAAKSALDSEVDYWHIQYEQARTRSKSNLPWPDAADLTSYIPCEKVDSVHARLMRTIFVSPICTVEGWGSSAERAPFVEEFHQWKAEEERLQSVFDRLSLISLIEPRGLLEVSESSERRTQRKTINAVPQMSPDGGFLFGPDGKPEMQLDAQGQYVEQSDPQTPAVEMVIDSSDVVRTGPQYRVIPYVDSVILPGHARDKQEIWGYGKRFWLRKPDLTQRAAEGVYWPDAVEQLNSFGERQPTPALERSLQGVVPQQTETAEKELWEFLILVDLNVILTTRGRDPLPGKAFDGPRWYVCTFHLTTARLLRFEHDDFEKARYVPFILFPRPDRATEGFSLVGNKLITITEEHTAYRNMAADRSAMAVNAPILKMQGALWDEDEQPMGPKSVITVRDPREISQLQVADVPASVFNQIAYCDRAAERLAGVNDIAAGQTTQGDKTLGEVQMATEQAFVRMDLIVRRFQEAMEDVFQIRHAIWKRVLAEQPDGVDAPESVLVGAEGRGVPIDKYLPAGKITAGLLDGAFRFKPYGSVETADLSKMRNDLIGATQALGLMLQAFPQLRPLFSTPQAARAWMRQFLRVFRIPNPQAFLGSPSQDMAQQAGIDQVPMPTLLQPPPPPPGMMPPGMGQPSAPPGMSPGMPQRGAPRALPPHGFAGVPAPQGMPGPAPGVMPPMASPSPLNPALAALAGLR